MSAAEPERCNSTLGGRQALQHACTFERGHPGRCSWWDWHQEQVARHEHARRWRGHLTPPAFQLQDYQGFLADRLTHRRPAPLKPQRDTGHER